MGRRGRDTRPVERWKREKKEAAETESQWTVIEENLGFLAQSLKDAQPSIRAMLEEAAKAAMGFSVQGASMARAYRFNGENGRPPMASLREEGYKLAYNVEKNVVEVIDPLNLSVLDRMDVEVVVVERDPKQGTVRLLDTATEAIQVTNKPNAINQASSPSEREAWSAMMESVDAIVRLVGVVEAYNPDTEQEEQWKLDELGRVATDMASALDLLSKKMTETPESIGMPMYTVFVGLSRVASLMKRVTDKRSRELGDAERDYPGFEERVNGRTAQGVVRGKLVGVDVQTGQVVYHVTDDKKDDSAAEAYTQTANAYRTFRAMLEEGDGPF